MRNALFYHGPLRVASFHRSGASRTHCAMGRCKGLPVVRCPSVGCVLTGRLCLGRWLLVCCASVLFALSHLPPILFVFRLSIHWFFPKHLEMFVQNCSSNG
ncbi:hypothetical protein TRVL_08299 [Trypanosoma vivax]|nr:hypothetical protein TRVL_08299 [Trypanosoma vivax]